MNELKSLTLNGKKYDSFPDQAVRDTLTLGVHTDGLVYTFVNGEPVGIGIRLPDGGGINGYVDSENNIVIKGDYADGTRVKFEMEDGTVIDIGELVYDEPAYTNVLPLAINSDGTPYNSGQGWKENTRLNSSGEESSEDGLEVTGFIPVKAGDVIRFKNINWKVNSGNTSCKAYVWLYKSDFTKPTVEESYMMSAIRETDSELAGLVEVDANGNLSEFTISADVFSCGDSSSVVDINEIAYMRVSAYEITSRSIITKNEPID